MTMPRQSSKAKQASVPAKGAPKPSTKSVRSISAADGKRRAAASSGTKAKHAAAKAGAKTDTVRAKTSLAGASQPAVAVRERRPAAGKLGAGVHRQDSGGEKEGPSGLEIVWERFKSTASHEAREQLILHFSPLVKYVASRVATGLPASVEQADLVSYGMFGLIDALEKFEPDRNIKFETYAIPRIRGAIIDELRSLDWVPRSVRFKHREFEKAYAEVEARLKRAPTDREIAEHLGISLPELHDIVTQISSVSILALDEPVSVGADRGETISLMDTLTDVHHSDLMAGLESDEMRAMLSAAITSLSDREKVVVTLYYFEGLTLSEIGDVLGVTESRVCQIHTKAVGQLRTRLVDHGED